MSKVYIKIQVIATTGDIKEYSNIRGFFDIKNKKQMSILETPILNAIENIRKRVKQNT